MEEVFDDPQIKRRTMVMDLDGAPSVRLLVRFSDNDLGKYSASPKLGENTYDHFIEK